MCELCCGQSEGGVLGAGLSEKQRSSQKRGDVFHNCLKASLVLPVFSSSVVRKEGSENLRRLDHSYLHLQ